MGTRVAPDGRTPWMERDAAMRRLGPIRRMIAEQAVDGVLPTPEQAEAYRERQTGFDVAHAAWMASRSAAQA